MKGRWVLYGFGLWFLLSGPLAGAPEQQASGKSLAQKVLEAWQAREQAAQQVKIRWQDTKTLTPGALNHPKIPKEVILLPAKTETWDSFYTLFLDGVKVKLVSDTIGISEKQEAKRQQQIIVFDGVLNKSFWPAQIHNYPQGDIGDEKYPLGLNTNNLRPVLLLFRPLRYAKLDYFQETDLLQARILAETMPLRERHCLVLRVVARAGSWRELWLDRERDYLPLREISYIGDRPFLQIDWLEYRQEKGLWVPLAWKWQRWRDQQVLWTTACRALEVQVNQPLPPDEFVLEFPEGTWITDRRQRDEHGNPTHYLIRASGKRPIAREELGKTYQELLQEETSSPQILKWGILVITLAGLVCLLYVFYRKRKKHASLP
jgi:hypothetical protein